MNENTTTQSSTDSTQATNDNSPSKAEAIRPGLPPTLHDPSEVNPSNLEQTDPNALIKLNQFWSYDPRTHMIGLTGSLTGIDHEKLDRHVSKMTAELNAGGWTVIIEYSATGEGRHVWYQRVHGGSKEQAVEHFRNTFFADQDKDWQNWSDVVSVHPGAYWPEYIKGYTTPPDQLEMHWQSHFF